MSPPERLPAHLQRGVVAGLAGTAVMTAFQHLVEMPLTKRDESYAPADLAMRLLPLQPKGAVGRRRLNYAMHFALGVGWGVARGVAAHRGLRGQRATLMVFGAMYPADAVGATALGVYRPSQWSALDVAIDIVDKLVLAEATGMAYDALESRP